MTHPFSKESSESAELPAAVAVRVVTMAELPVIRMLNAAIFNEERVINRFDRAGLLILIAYVNDEPVGFKIGYRFDAHTFYSAKGGVLPAFRRRGIARELLYVMIEHVRSQGYQRFLFDTFPNKHPGMTIMALEEGFRVSQADYNDVYLDYRLQFEKNIVDANR